MERPTLNVQRLTSNSPLKRARIGILLRLSLFPRFSEPERRKVTEMQTLTVLSAIENIESSVAKLYEWFSECFTADREASGFFFRLAMQERSHANMVAFSKGLVRRSPNDFSSVDFDMALVDDLLQMVSNFRTQHPQPSLPQALDFSMAIENHAAEGIHRSMVIQSNPEVADMINNLAKDDREHSRLLKEYAERIRNQAQAAG